jgi:CRP-like cAMP-binding protein
LLNPRGEDFSKFTRKRKQFKAGLIKPFGGLASGRSGMISTNRLRKIDFLHGLTEEELNRIAHFFTEEDAGAGVTLCEEGAKAERLYVLEHGKVSISSKNGRKYHIDTPGKIVGWSFLVPPFFYTASVVTVNPSKLLVTQDTKFYYFIHKEPKMEIKVLSNLTRVIASRLKGT